MHSMKILECEYLVVVHCIERGRIEDGLLLINFIMALTSITFAQELLSSILQLDGLTQGYIIIYVPLA